MWAGSTATINEYLQKQGKSRIGFANPTLYALANSQQQYPPFHDVTSGDNLYYPATANYDLASGLGSPDIYNIARDIAGGNVPTPSPSPGPTGTPSPTPTATATDTPVPTPTATDTPVSTPTDTPTPVPPTSGSLIQNGGFEEGVDPWQESSANGYELIDNTNPHSGSYSAFLCGYSSCNDTIAQEFTVPGSAHTLNVSYWWYADTSRTTHSCRDVFTVAILDSHGTVLGRLQRACNTNVTRNWKHVSFDVTHVLSNHAGQSVILVFNAKTASSFSVTSVFFVDDVEVRAS
jgi:kumamolisin